MMSIVGRVRSWFALDWVGDDDLYAAANSEITPFLFVGRRPTADGVLTLQRLGVTHVVSCLPEAQRDEIAFVHQDFDHLFLAARDDMAHDLGHTFEHFFAHVDATAGANPAARMLVHCEVGVSRSASLAIALLMRDRSMSFLDAFEFVRSKRIQVLPNLGFASQLQRLEHQLLPDRRNSGVSSLSTYLTRYCNVPSPIDEIQVALERADFDAPTALRSMYGGEIPRVVQGVRAAR